MKLQDSQTWKNIETALNQEALAHVEYVFYSQQAKKDGYVQYANLFQETADNELAHAKLLFKRLHDGGVPDTMANLAAAAHDERSEFDSYQAFAYTAREEGFDDLGDFFDGLAAIEKTHEERYETMIERIENDEVFKRAEIKVWYCTVCGHLEIGTEAPEKCPVCDHPQSHFEIRATNW